MKKVEFLIVGSGLAGTLLAYEMKKAGLSFQIISSAQKKRASMVAAGMVNPLVFKRLTKSWKVDELLPVMNETYSFLEDFLQEKFYFPKNVVKPLSEQETKLWQEKQELPEFSGYIKTIHKNAPVNNLKAAFAFGIINGSGYLNLSHLLSSSERYFRAENLWLDHYFTYEEIKRNKPVQLNNTQFKTVVFCEGAHVVNNPFFRFLKMNPVKGEVLEIESPVLPEDFILNKKVFVLPVGNQIFKLGSTYNWADLSNEITSAGKQSILERFQELVNVPYKVINHVAGVRPTVIDRRPILGRHPEFENITIFNGLGTKGVMLAPFFAKEMLRFLTHKNYSLSEEINSNRFL
jgi:glycine/D-amino acid oxidase-like deaminating enzyme